MPDICDFCGRPDGHWSYPCRSFIHDKELLVAGTTPGGESIVAEVAMRAGYDGDWTACEGCHALIKRGDRERLCRRAAKRLQHSPEGAGMGLNALRVLIRPLHDQFWSNREGAPSRL